MEEYVEIGHTKKTYGIEGELKVYIEDAYLDDFWEAEILFLEVKGGKVPYFVEKRRETSSLLVKLDDIDTPEAATPLTGTKVFLREQDLKAAGGREGVSPDFSMLEGYVIQDEEKGEIGLIEEVMELPQQLMAVVSYRGKEVLIPLNDQLIKDIDQQQKKLYMALPEGLLEL